MYASNSPPVPSSFSSSTALASETFAATCWDAPIKAPPPAPSRAGRSHQRSRTSVDLPPLLSSPSKSPTRNSIFLPFRSSEKGHSPTTSPPKSPTHEIDDLDFADEERSGIRLESKQNKLASWFNGSSDPINIGLIPSPVKEEEADPFDKDEMERRDSKEHNLTGPMPSRPVIRLQNKTSITPTRPTPAPAGRFSFFKSKPVAESTNQKEVSDGLTKLDISTALFPVGPADEFSPAAFKNLQMNAEGTIRKFQTAYSGALQSLREVTSERNVQADELEAAETRNEHLKLQLTDMAERATEQEKAIKSLADELRAEKQRRIEAEDFRKNTVKMIPSTGANQPETPNRPASRRNRVSAASSTNESDFDSEMSSCADSVFSERFQHGGSSPTPTTPSEMSPDMPQPAKFQQVNASMTLPRSDSSERTPTSLPQYDMGLPRTCQICHGMPSSEAWDVVGILKEENKALKGTIQNLEAGLESTLDLVSGLM